ncbi:type II toxin-antitoxin system death-on-curing family toxin [Mammaliicoccus lentus]|uniref:type II toxin-antitoxin system death-on-curing family toxin n=1 Tax=Mammaliicoccus lentus TaxID=42858 RepID=UPI0024A81833|nr:type II toxin-antitoxin system death-on-curing family toxin [Mammaliicoccus lentus]WHI54943.1 type II toxin-antitoxin system death-on-curing family toxin [Mammaliicoccus lentus]WHI57465.1 type II toxin-antitoxin system death-on-curing family toxin [Mammaliicoccus lentus]WHI65312.1 type II toxin-antitoxin system death-on-curing family toxin [Mammaliicoccus lentus]WHI86204.1 type II toxin-antitoxin system death-on-curing family toxin [Mammaliicoccus lentus]WHI90713.1 type II toxin-antitoxin s
MIRYLTEKEIITFNIYVIQKYSPKEPIGVVDATALNMLVNAPKQYVFGIEQYPTLALKAINLFRNLVKKHVFYNGNKRTAFICLNIFLNLNGYELEVNTKEAIDFTVMIATHDLQEDDIEQWILKHIKIK